MSTMPLIGQTLGDYRLQAVLGRGGMSVVFRAENLRLGSTVAVKVLAPELAHNDVFRERFIHESHVAAALNHPNVIPIFDAGAYEDLLFIAMRYVAGADLRSVLKEQGSVSIPQALLLIGQTGRALDTAHRRGLVHRDVKPANILIERGVDGDPDHVYLADFGITKHALSQSGLTGTGQFVGTIDYVAPEQILGKPVDGRSDLYSLGCVLYECLTGSVPFRKEHDAAVIWAQVEEPPPPVTSLAPSLPPGIDDVVGKAMAKSPDERYQSCRAFVEAASAVLDPGRTHVGRTASSLVGSVAAASLVSQPPAPPPVAAPPPVPPPAPPPAPATSAGASDPSPPPTAPAGAQATHVPVVPPLAARPTTEHRLPAAAPPTPPPAGRPRPRRRRWPLVVAAVVVAAAIAGGGAWLGLRGGGGDDTAHGHAQQPPRNAILSALAVANRSADARGQVRLAGCRASGATLVTCTRPAEAITAATFRTYPTLHAVYMQYTADVAQLSARHEAMFNMRDCQAKDPFGEVGWNHAFQHPKMYSVRRSESGALSEMELAGRVFCTIDNDGQAQIVWTMNAGNLLGRASGAPHEDVFRWWRRVHHNIALAGEDMEMHATTGAMTTPTGGMTTGGMTTGMTTGSMGG